VKRGALLAAAMLVACGKAPKPVPETATTTVAVIAPSTAQNLDALGLADRVVGVSDYCAVDSMAELPRVGGLTDPSLERLLRLDPDLLLVQGASPLLEDFARESGIAFRSFNTDSIAAWKDEVHWLGEHFDAAAAATALVADLEAQLDELRAAAPPLEERPRVLLVASRRPGEAAGILAVGPGGFLDELLEAAGGRNVLAEADRRYVDLSEESLLRLDPALILELGTADADPLATWRAAFPRLQAVQNNKVLALEGEDLLMPGPGMGRVAAAIAEKLSG
jgi:iron complex transport system substrate-binding protein